MLLQKNIVKKYLALLPDEQTQEAWKWVREPPLDPSYFSFSNSLCSSESKSS